MRLLRLTLLPLLLLVVALPSAYALSSPDDVNLDPGVLTVLESRADHAAPREQCFLYTELVQAYTQVAGKQIAEGQTDLASATLQRVQGFAARIHMALASDTKRLKNAEMIMHAASRHLCEYLHHASTDDKAVVESTLKQLDRVNEELLAQVFAH